MAAHCSAGQQVWVKVLGYRHDSRKQERMMSLAMACVDQKTGRPASAQSCSGSYHPQRSGALCYKLLHVRTLSSLWINVVDAQLSVIPAQ